MSEPTTPSPTAAAPSFEPQSWLSAHLGLDKHPDLESTVNKVLGTAAAAAGADVNAAVSQAVSSGTITQPEVVNTAVTALKDAGATISASDVTLVIDAIIDHVPVMNSMERIVAKTLANGLIGLIFHK
jgi:hypothetical protein